MRGAAGVGVAALAAALLSGCNPTADNDSSAVSITAVFQGSDDVVGIFSDVVNDDGTVSDDFFDITVESIPKAGTDPGDFYTVEFEGVQIVYTRPDGKNEPGVDVPFPLTYALGGFVEPGGDTDINTLVVSKEMKLQPPLRNLWFSNQRIFATVNLRIFGHDRVENSVSADASAVVLFEDI